MAQGIIPASHPAEGFGVNPPVLFVKLYETANLIDQPFPGGAKLLLFIACHGVGTLPHPLLIVHKINSVWVLTE